MNWFGAAFKGLMQGAWAHRWLFGVPVATCLLLATLHAIRLPDVYQAKAVLEIKNVSQGSGSDLPMERAQSVEAVAETARDRLFSQTPIKAVVALLDRNEKPDGEKSLDERIEQTRKMIEYERITDFSLRVSFTHKYPETAKMALDRLLETFLEEERREPLETAERNADFYAAQVKNYAKERKQAYEKLDAFNRENHATLPEQQTAISFELQQGTTNLGTERNQRAQIDGRLDKLRGNLAHYRSPRNELVKRTKTPQEDMAADALTKARKRLEEADKTFNNVRTRFTPNSKQYQAAEADRKSAEALERRLAEELRSETAKADQAWQKDQASYITREIGNIESFIRQAESELKLVDGRIEAIQKGMADAQNRLRKIPQTKEARGKLERIVDEWEKRHDEARREATLHTKLATYYRDSPASEVTRFRIAQPAIVPFKPSGPSRARWVLTGFLVGAIIGYGLLLLRRRYTVASAVGMADIEALLPGAMVVTVPMLGPGHRPRPLVSASEVLFGIWTFGCLLLTVLAFGAYKGWLTAPSWLTGWIGG